MTRDERRKRLRTVAEQQRRAGNLLALCRAIGDEAGLREARRNLAALDRTALVLWRRVAAEHRRARALELARAAV